ncbi:MAG: exodeoxyribonuclease III, partial [Alphaproteobacteria bacterium]|nr:exodeoxyribonuclease III [Alphaproteobacteria bacterium]
MDVTLTTWNINSVRLRIDQVEAFIKTHQPDILCLQETKVADPLFPSKMFTKQGYEHAAIAGQKGYHGVATLSRIPFEQIDRRDWCGKGDARHISVRFEGGAELHNFYVPAGGDIPDPNENDKFAHKLDFLDEMAVWFGAERQTEDKLILVGDLNVAPSEHDVWSHKQLLKVV